MFYHNINPILAEVGPFQIRYYGILMALAFLIGYFIIIKLAEERGIKRQNIEELFLFMMIGLIVGARLGEVLFYNPGYYFSNPEQILYVWKGGLASHGAVIGGVLVMWWYSKKKKIQFYDIADIAVIPIALGAAFVRVGNFFNGEIVGRVTSIPWAVKFKGYEGFRHPSQLYEAAKNLLIFGILWNMKSVKNLPKGFLFWSFGALYGLLRFFVEYFKEYQTLPSTFPLTMGQVLSIPMFLISVFMLYRISKKS